MIGLCKKINYLKHFDSIKLNHVNPAFNEEDVLYSNTIGKVYPADNNYDNDALPKSYIKTPDIKSKDDTYDNDKNDPRYITNSSSSQTSVPQGPDQPVMVESNTYLTTIDDLYS